jgi:hypothetical protein
VSAHRIGGPIFEATPDVSSQLQSGTRKTVKIQLGANRCLTILLQWLRLFLIGRSGRRVGREHEINDDF